MIQLARCLVDTSILLRLSTATRDRFPWSYQAVAKLLAAQCELCYTPHNAAEFWEISTRPIGAGGHGLSGREAAQLLGWIEQGMTLLPDTPQVYALWRDLVATHDLRGVEVHHARLAASMLANNVSHVLTLSTADFARFPGIEALHPSAI